MKKYKILECLDQLTVREYRAVIKLMPKITGKSINTFWNYAGIDSNSNMDVPYGVVVRLELFFKLKPGALTNVAIECKTLDELLAERKP